MLLTALIFIAILSILVFVHEFGHFTVARLIGVKVEEFGFGLPPRILGKKIKETIYSINWLPIGGFVKLAGEDELAEVSHPKIINRKQFFWARTKKERAAILLAGVTMNFILAVGITTYLLTQGVAEVSGRVHIEDIVAGSPAQAAGLVKKDIIEKISYTADDGRMQEKSIRVPTDLIDTVRAHVGEPVTLTVNRGGDIFATVLTPRTDFPKGEGPMGVAISDLEIKMYPITQAPFVAVKTNLVRAWEMLAGLGNLIVKLVRLQPVGQDVAGPIGIAQVTGTAVKFGWKAVLEFMSILSLNLAVLNILPIPALDGGRLAFVVFEKILGRKVKPAFEQKTHSIGMIILFLLILLISINDILRLARGG